MRIVLAPQEFKGSLTAAEAAAAMRAGALRALPGARIDAVPLADGGPGTVEAVVTAAGGRYSHARVEGPLGDPVTARWGRIDDGRTAIIEMAAASGLLLVPPGRLDPRRASTIGTGELIGAALDAGVSRLLVGVGGSATNDGGAGMATALGARFLDDDGRPIAPGGAALAGLARIDVGGLDPRLAAVEVRVLADVRNPLTGPDGASAVYGPQKGADATTIAELDRALTHFADIVARDVGADILTLPGGGAAGGLGAGLIAFTGARIEPGIEAIASAVRLDARLAGADVVLTGEGSLDRQSAFGKTVAGVAGRAAAAGVPCLAAGGRVRDGDAVRAIPGLRDVEAAAGADIGDAEAMAQASVLLAAASERLLRRWRGSGQA